MRNHKNKSNSSLLAFYFKFFVKSGIPNEIEKVLINLLYEIGKSQSNVRKVDKEKEEIKHG